MASQIAQAYRDAVAQIPSQAVLLLLCAGAFLALSIWLRGLAGALKNARAAGEETRINLIFWGLDMVTIGPLLTLMATGGGVLLHRLWPDSPMPAFWAWLGAVPTVLITVFVGDFVAYWRHRAQHSRWLWPAHAIHHSDTRMTWLTLERMHPVDRIGSNIDLLVLSALGFPVWALAANVMVRHYYGYLIHVDAPWTLGRLSLVFNSPAMHRWHHARPIEYSGKNFATVFSVFDRAFGTFYQPGPCAVPLGVPEDMGRGAAGQYLHPFKVWLGVGRPAPAPSGAPASV